MPARHPFHQIYNIDIKIMNLDLKWFYHPSGKKCMYVNTYSHYVHLKNPVNLESWTLAGNTAQDCSLNICFRTSKAGCRPSVVLTNPPNKEHSLSTQIWNSQMEKKKTQFVDILS